MAKPVRPATLVDRKDAFAVSRTLFRNFTLLLGGSILGQLAFFFGLIHLARVLGPSGFGSWSFAQTWLLYLFRAGELGIEVLAIREISRHPEVTTEWMKRSYWLRVSMATALVVLTLILVSLNLFPAHSISLVIVFSLGVLVWSFTLEWVLEGRQDVLWVGLVRVMKGVLFALPVFLLVKTPNDTIVSAWVYIGSLAISVAIIAFIVIRRYGWSKKEFSPLELRGTLLEAMPVGVATLLSQYSMFIGTIVIGYLLNGSELGYFAAGHRIVVFLWAYVIVSSNRVLLPTLARYFRSSKSDFQGFMRKFFRLSVVVAIPLGLMGTLFAPVFLPVLYGDLYSSSTFVFQILLWGLVAAIVRSIFEIGMIASDDQRKYLHVMVIQAVVYTLTTITLTTTAGIVGTAIACLISEVVILLYVVIAYSPAREAAQMQDVWKPLASLTAAILMAILIPSGVVTRAIVSAATYGAVFVVLGGITRDDVRLLKNLVSLEGDNGSIRSQ